MSDNIKYIPLSDLHRNSAVSFLEIMQRFSEPQTLFDFQCEMRSIAGYYNPRTRKETIHDKYNKETKQTIIEFKEC